MKRLLRLVVLLPVVFTIVNAPRPRVQAMTAGVPQVEFEVASVKPTKQMSGVSQGCRGIDTKIAPNDPRALVPLGRCVVSSGRLSHMIGMAYGITMDMLRGGPDWVAGGYDRYDVEAKADDPATTTEKQLIAMFRNLLAERFKLKLHRESHEMDGFALLVGKNGLKMKQAGEDEERQPIVRADGSDNVALVKKSAVEADRRDGVGVLMVMTGQRVSPADLLNALSPFAGRHLVDETGLTGFYDFKLTWESGQSLAGPLQDQLGLRLESRKIAVDYIIVDSAEKPTLN
jgi:uncharacterized protein (TIGR03435 family)